MFSHGPTVFWEVPCLLCDRTGNTGQQFCPAPQRLWSATVRFDEQDGGSGVHACRRHVWVSPEDRVLRGPATLVDGDGLQAEELGCLTAGERIVAIP